jgi:branched-subunit amino acid transport protein
MSAAEAPVWVIIVFLGIGTFALRFSFLGLLGNRDLPDWILRHLRYTVVAILPALVAPLVIWSRDGETLNDPGSLIVAIATLAVGYWTKSTKLAIAIGGFGFAFLLMM